MPPTTTQATRRPSDLEWTRVPFDLSSDVAQWMTGVAVLDGQLIAVGADMSAGDPDAAVWRSADGVIWSRVPHDEDVFGGEEWQSMSGVAAFGEGVVAVGKDGNDGAVWMSPDGVSWTRVHDDLTFRDTDISDVASYDGGVIAVGIDFHTEGLPPGAVSVGPAVWTSVDGYSWTRVASGAFESESPQWMQGVASGDSVIVAVGLGHKVREVDGAAWTSADGYAWTALEDEAFGGSGAQLMRRVTWSGSAFVAVGWSGVNAAVWTSPDGVSWMGVPHDATVFGGAIQDELRIDSVVALEDGVVAVGHIQKNSDLEDAAIWVSDDGVAWTRLLDEALLAGPGQQMIEAVVGFKGGLVAVGRGGASTVPAPSVWLGTFPDK